MRCKKKLLRFLAVAILFSLLIPTLPECAFAEEPLAPISVWAEQLFDARGAYIELVESNDRYYISAEGLGQISNLDVSMSGNAGKLTGEMVSFSFDLTGISHISYADQTWFLLEDILNATQIYFMSNGDGVLYFNSPVSNLNDLLLTIDPIMSRSYFSADMLEEMGLVSDVANVVANVYDIATNFRVNALWGGAYAEDVKEKVMELLQPLQSEENLFSDIKGINGKLNKAAKIILNTEKAYEDVKEFFTRVPSGGDVLLFGIEGTDTIRESLETIKGVNNADIANLFLRARLGYSGMKEYSQALDNLDGDYLTGIHALNISDFLTIGEYIVDTTNVSSEYALAFDNVLRRRQSNESKSLWSKAKRNVIAEQAETVISDYKAYIEQNYLSMFGSSVVNTVSMMSDNLTQDGIKKALMGSGSLWSDLFVAGINYLTNTDKKTNAVKGMYILSDIQSLFKDCYIDAVSKGVEPGDAIYCKDVALLYLKSAWHAADEFSFDTPTASLKSNIESAMSAIKSFPNEMFSVVQSDEIYSVGTFLAAEDDSPFEIICRPDISASETEPAVRLPYDMKWYTPCCFEIREKASQKSLRTFWLPIDTESLEHFYPNADEMRIIVNDTDHLVFEVWTEPGGIYNLSYDVKHDKLTELNRWLNYNKAWDEYLIGTTFDVTGGPVSLYIETLDGDPIDTVVESANCLHFYVSGNKLYYLFSTTPLVWDAPNNTFEIRKYTLDSSRQSNFLFSLTGGELQLEGLVNNELLISERTGFGPFSLYLYSLDGQTVDVIETGKYSGHCYISSDDIYYSLNTTNFPDVESADVYEIWKYQASSRQRTFVFSIECKYLLNLGDGFVEYSDGRTNKRVYW